MLKEDMKWILKRGARCLGQKAHVHIGRIWQEARLQICGGIESKRRTHW